MRLSGPGDTSLGACQLLFLSLRLLLFYRPSKYKPEGSFSLTPEGLSFFLAGNRIVTHCTIPETASQCQPCDRDTYFKYMNQLDKCLPCKICRDLVEIQPCTQTSDTECRCKNGTYCVPRLPCETCHRCTPSCPNGEKMEQPCTPTNNIKCVPLPTSPTPATATNVGMYVCIWVCDGFSIKTSRACSTVLQPGKLLSPFPSESRFGNQCPRILPFFPAFAATQPFVFYLLLALSLSLEIFVKEVPVMQWRRYMRALGLTSNEIHTVAMSESHVNEQHFQMLQLWLDKNGRKATLDVLLQALCDIEHRGVEERVRRMLIDQGLYVWEEVSSGGFS
uniref:Uncharacterized protein n=1 Tax=Varanus komodoensis TaxID=61221 RepID=A0A8D2LA19_VARKO